MFFYWSNLAIYFIHTLHIKFFVKNRLLCGITIFRQANLQSYFGEYTTPVLPQLNWQYFIYNSEGEKSGLDFC